MKNINPLGLFDDQIVMEKLSKLSPESKKQSKIKKMVAQKIDKT